MNEIIEAVNRAAADAEGKAAVAADSAALEALRIEYLGRNGLFPELSKKMGSVPPEQRKENAARRRRAETQAAIDAAVAAERAKTAARETELIKALGLRDPYNGNKPIETREQYDEYIRIRDEKTLERELSTGKLSPDTLDRVIDRRIAEKTKPAPQEESKNMAELNRQYEMLKEIDPNVPSLEDLGKDANFVAALKDTGHLVRAYQKVANTSAKANAVAQESSDGIHHFIVDAGAENALLPDLNGGVVVTDSMRRAYRMLFPNISDEEIRKYEEKDKKRK